MACAEDITIVRGSTFQRVVRWETSPVIYKTITGITAAAPAVVTAASHGVPDGWRVAISGVQGMTEINAKHTPPWASDYYRATVLTANTIELNRLDASEFTAWSSGGALQYNTPQSLTGYTARMTIKNRVGGTAIETLTSVDGDIVISTASYTITITISAAATAAYTATHGVYDLEMVSSGGVVTKLLSGKVAFKNEVTT